MKGRSGEMTRIQLKVWGEGGQEGKGRREGGGGSREKAGKGGGATGDFFPNKWHACLDSHTQEQQLGFTSLVVGSG